MRFLILVFTFALLSNLSFVSAAQDKAEPPKRADTGSSEHKTAKNIVTSNQNSNQNSNEKSNEEAESEKDVVEREEFDLDKFFKQGEENAKNGSSCEKPPEPVA